MHNDYYYYYHDDDDDWLLMIDLIAWLIDLFIHSF